MIGVLVSGNGTNLQALLDAPDHGITVAHVGRRHDHAVPDPDVEDPP